MSHSATDPTDRHTVAVIGAGYVGLPTAATLAHFGHHVVLAERECPGCQRCAPAACRLWRPGWTN